MSILYGSISLNSVSEKCVIFSEHHDAELIWKLKLSFLEKKKKKVKSYRPRDHMRYEQFYTKSRILASIIFYNVIEISMT